MYTKKIPGGIDFAVYPGGTDKRRELKERQRIVCSCIFELILELLFDEQIGVDLKLSLGFRQTFTSTLLQESVEIKLTHPEKFPTQRTDSFALFIGQDFPTDGSFKRDNG